mmetsp:Transcript_25829/g.75702  ORF Transcript_25829/g.75702 Transcript_25829/m.75702 type:complete len:260 (+) Transcript_25829:232-1011(+)
MCPLLSSFSCSSSPWLSWPLPTANAYRRRVYSRAQASCLRACSAFAQWRAWSRRSLPPAGSPSCAATRGRSFGSLRGAPWPFTPPQPFGCSQATTVRPPPSALASSRWRPRSATTSTACASAWPSPQYSSPPWPHSCRATPPCLPWRSRRSWSACCGSSCGRWRSRALCTRARWTCCAPAMGAGTITWAMAPRADWSSFWSSPSTGRCTWSRTWCTWPSRAPWAPGTSSPRRRLRTRPSGRCSALSPRALAPSASAPWW